MKTSGAGFGVFLFLGAIFLFMFLFTPLDVMLNSLGYFFNRSLGELLSDPMVIIAIGGSVIIIFLLLMLFSFNSGFRR